MPGLVRLRPQRLSLLSLLSVGLGLITLAVSPARADFTLHFSDKTNETVSASVLNTLTADVTWAVKAGDPQTLELTVKNTSVYTIDTIDFNSTPDIEFAGNLKDDITGTNGGTITRLDPTVNNRAGFGAMEWGIDFAGSNFLPGGGTYVFDIGVSSPDPFVNPFLAQANSLGNFGAVHFTRGDGVLPGGSIWGANNSGAGGSTDQSVVPDGASLSLLCGGLLPLAGLGLLRRRRRTAP
jgi:hypothetical protein